MSAEPEFEDLFWVVASYPVVETHEPGGTREQAIAAAAKFEYKGIPARVDVMRTYRPKNYTLAEYDAMLAAQS